MTSNSEYFDYLVVGGGVVGMSIARELATRFPLAKIGLLEKEKSLSSHASGRNSGVLHAGFYYSPDSLKAKLTREGNESLKSYCLDKKLNIINCGKVVVTKDESELAALHKLYTQGLQNGVTLELVNPARLSELEPLAKTHELAMWSPNTAVADPAEVAMALGKDLLASGVKVFTETKVQAINNQRVETDSGQSFRYGHLVNAAGLYSDRIAKMLGFGQRFTMLPFIGLYYYAPKLLGALKSHIYPVPDARNPFLGVHYTRTAKNELKVGPTAIPVISREQYALFEGFNFGEMAEIFFNYPKFFFSKHHDVLSLLKSELPKLSRKHLLGRAKYLSDAIDVNEFTKPGKPGIRAQLFDTEKGKLEMDFVIEGDYQSTHVLNAVSPGWTTCLSFARYVVDDLVERT